MIRVLNAAVVGQIAAGEVVERPSSVAKELIENALDAGATSITVEIKDGGTTYLRVTDNGCGIAPNEVRLAFENHATSKLVKEEDLIDIRTLGFRGEALPSIAAVSKVEVTTRVRGAESGVKLRIEGGAFIGISETGCPEGTSIIVRDLFFNVPVRRSFLKKPAYEAGVMSDMVTRLMLGNPNISIRFINNGRTVYHSFGDGNLKHAALAVYGREIAGQLMEIDGMQGGVRIWGLLGIGNVSRSNRAEQCFFINGRLVRCTALTQVVEQVCRERVTIGMHPMCILNVALPHLSVDVNVHPNKLEVRFRDETAMRLSVQEMLAKALSGTKMLNPETQLAQSMNMPTTEVHYEPPILENKTEVLNMPDGSSEDEEKYTEVLNDVANPTNAQTKVFKDENSQKTKVYIENSANNPQKHEKKSSVRADFSHEKTSRQDIGDQLQYNITRKSGPPLSPMQELREERVFEKPAQATHQIDMPETEAVSIQGKEEEPEEFFRLIGVLFNTYVLVEYKEALLLIDQHAAHERLIYERYMRLLEDSGRTESQQLLIPTVVSVTPRELALLDENTALLKEIGYDIEIFGERTIQIRAVPFVLGSADMKPIFLQMIDQMDQLRAATIERKRAEIIQFSCKHAVKAGDALTDGEIHSLIEAMRASGAPPTCPHGRPVMKIFTKGEFEKMFKRRQ